MSVEDEIQQPVVIMANERIDKSIREFNGKGDYFVWMSHVNRVAKARNWNEGHKLSAIAAALDGDAASLYDLLEEEGTVTLDKLTKAMEKAYGKRASRSKFTTELSKRKQQPDEPPDQYHRELLRLVKRAMPNVGTEAQKELVFHYFKEGVKDSIRQAFISNGPTTMEDALKLAERVEDDLRSYEDESNRMNASSRKPNVQVLNVDEVEDNSRQSTSDLMKNPNFITMAEAFASYLGISPSTNENSVNNVQQEQQDRWRYQNCGGSQRGLHRQQSSNYSQSIDCYNCGKKGHVSKSCTAPRKNQHQTMYDNRSNENVNNSHKWCEFHHTRSHSTDECWSNRNQQRSGAGSSNWRQNPDNPNNTPIGILQNAKVDKPSSGIA